MIKLTYFCKDENSLILENVETLILYQDKFILKQFDRITLCKNEKIDDFVLLCFFIEGIDFFDIAKKISDKMDWKTLYQLFKKVKFECIKKSLKNLLKATKFFDSIRLTKFVKYFKENSCIFSPNIYEVISNQYRVSLEEAIKMLCIPKGDLEEFVKGELKRLKEIKLL